MICLLATVMPLVMNTPHSREYIRNEIAEQGEHGAMSPPPRQTVTLCFTGQMVEPLLAARLLRVRHWTN